MKINGDKKIENIKEDEAMGEEGYETYSEEDVSEDEDNQKMIDWLFFYLWIYFICKELLIN